MGSSSPKVTNVGPSESDLAAQRAEERHYQEKLRQQMRREAKIDEKERRAYEEERAKKMARVNMRRAEQQQRLDDARERNVGSQQRSNRKSMFNRLSGNIQIPSGGNGSTYN